MLKGLLKFFVFSSIILLFGQIQVAQSTIGEIFHSKVIILCRWGGQKLSDTKMFSSLADTAVLKELFQFAGVYSVSTNQQGSHPSDLDGVHEDDISEADRDSILRLLQ